jgi:hypothetical protein
MFLARLDFFVYMEKYLAINNRFERFGLALMLKKLAETSKEVKIYFMTST